MFRPLRALRKWALPAPPPPPPPPPPAPPKRDWHKAATLVVAVLALIAAILAIPGLLGVFDGSDAATDAKASLRVDSFIVRNGPDDIIDVGGRMMYSPESAPTLDIALVNTGTGPGTVTSVRARIVDYEDLEYCGQLGGGGDVPIDVTYTLNLRANPRPSERDLASEPFVFAVEPAATERFELRLSGPPDTEDPHLYLLDVTLVSKGGGGKLELGRVLVSAPGAVSRADAYLPEEGSKFDGVGVEPDPTLASLWCFARNLADVQRMVGARGARMSDELAALASAEAAPEFTRRLARVPPAEAARQLLRDANADPGLAVFAAQRADDEELVNEIRTAAAREFERRSRQALLDDNPGYAVSIARRGLEVLETAELARSLSAGERRLRARAQSDEGES